MIKFPRLFKKDQKITFQSNEVIDDIQKLREMARLQLSRLYFAEIESYDFGFADYDEKKIPINTVGRWLFGVPNYEAHLLLMETKEGYALKYPSKAPAEVHHLAERIVNMLSDEPYESSQEHDDDVLIEDTFVGVQADSMLNSLIDHKVKSIKNESVELIVIAYYEATIEGDLFTSAIYKKDIHSTRITVYKSFGSESFNSVMDMFDGYKRRFRIKEEPRKPSIKEEVVNSEYCDYECPPYTEQEMDTPSSWEIIEEKFLSSIKRDMHISR